MGAITHQEGGEGGDDRPPRPRRVCIYGETIRMSYVVCVAWVAWVSTLSTVGACLELAPA